MAQAPLPKGLGNINWRDLWKGLYYAAIGQLLALIAFFVTSLLQETPSFPTWVEWLPYVKATVFAIGGYLAGKMGVNNVGQILKKDRPVVRVDVETLNDLKEGQVSKTSGIKNIVSLLFIAIIVASCNVNFVPTKSETALNMVYKIQQDATNAFYMPTYNEAAYAVVNEEIDSLISFDKARVKSGTILKQDAAIQNLFQEFQREHKAKTKVVESEQNAYKSYFKSVIDPRIISENSLR